MCSAPLSLLVLVVVMLVMVAVMVLLVSAVLMLVVVVLLPFVGLPRPSLVCGLRVLWLLRWP